MRLPRRSWTQRALIRFATDSHGTMSLTFAQLFMGALTIGLGSFRGTEAYLSFYYETQVGHANYAATKLGADHARAANTNTNNNVISASIMGPRFGVEADNITMDADAAIACPQTHNAHMQKICAEYMAGKPRALAKLLWVRLKQQFIWGALGQLTSTIDKVASLGALDQVRSSLPASGDGNVSIRAEDPSTSGNIWGGDNTPTGCSLAQRDALPSEMPGHAFPILMENLLEGLPKALVATLPQVICGATSMGGGGGGGSGASSLINGASSLVNGASGFASNGANQNPIKLPEVPSISKDTSKQCGDLEDQMQTQIQRARDAQAPRDSGGGHGGGGGGGYAAQGNYGELGDNAAGPVFSNELAPYVHCAVSSPENAQKRQQARSNREFGSGYGSRNSDYSYMDPKSHQLTACTFDADKCQNDKLESNTASFLHNAGLPASSSESNLGGATHAPSDSDWNHADSMRACAYSSADVNSKIVNISNAARTVMSFGQSGPSTSLSERHEYQSCAKWYFPDGAESQFSSTPHDQQPFVAAWKFAPVAGRN